MAYVGPNNWTTHQFLSRFFMNSLKLNVLEEKSYSFNFDWQPKIDTFFIKKHSDPVGGIHKEYWVWIISSQKWFGQYCFERSFNISTNHSSSVSRQIMTSFLLWCYLVFQPFLPPNHYFLLRISFEMSFNKPLFSSRMRVIQALWNEKKFFCVLVITRLLRSRFLWNILILSKQKKSWRFS